LELKTFRLGFGLEPEFMVLDEVLHPIIASDPRLQGQGLPAQADEQVDGQVNDEGDVDEGEDGDAHVGVPFLGKLLRNILGHEEHIDPDDDAGGDSGEYLHLEAIGKLAH